MKKLFARINRIRKYCCPHCRAEFLIPIVRDGKEYCPACGGELSVNCDGGRPGA